MKKFMLGLAALAIILSGTVASHAADSHNFQLIVIVSSEAVAITNPGPFVEFGNFVQPGTDNLSTGSAGIRNIGFNNLDLFMTANSSGTWVQNEVDGESLSGDDTYRLYGIFTEVGRTLASADFAANDILSTTEKEASSTVFALDTEEDEFKAIDIPNGKFRNMYFRLILSSNISAEAAATGQLAVDMVVRAEAH